MSEEKGALLQVERWVNYPAAGLRARPSPKRNGDRIESKAEKVNLPVVIYEPYLAGTHEEKMFRVVKDRERWFGVVMGETPDWANGQLNNRHCEFRYLRLWRPRSPWICP